jgi:hypothetical protein
MRPIAARTMHSLIWQPSWLHAIVVQWAMQAHSIYQFYLLLHPLPSWYTICSCIYIITTSHFPSRSAAVSAVPLRKYFVPQESSSCLVCGDVSQSTLLSQSVAFKSCLPTGGQSMDLYFISESMRDSNLDGTWAIVWIPSRLLHCKKCLVTCIHET